jgi:hypothetical protein
MDKKLFVLPFYMSSGIKVVFPKKGSLILNDKTYFHVVNNDKLSEADFKLEVRPLETMSFEEALELCKVVDPAIYGDYRYSKWEVSVDQKGFTDLWKAFSVKNKNSDCEFCIDLIEGDVRVYEKGEGLVPVRNQLYWQWLLQKGFDLRFMPDSKTLIESGIGVAMNDFDIDMRIIRDDQKWHSWKCSCGCLNRRSNGNCGRCGGLKHPGCQYYGDNDYDVFITRVKQ